MLHGAVQQPDANVWLHADHNTGDAYTAGGSNTWGEGEGDAFEETDARRGEAGFGWNFGESGQFEGQGKGSTGEGVDGDYYDEGFNSAYFDGQGFGTDNQGLDTDDQDFDSDGQGLETDLQGFDSGDLDFDSDGEGDTGDEAVVGGGVIGGGAVYSGEVGGGTVGGAVYSGEVYKGEVYGGGPNSGVVYGGAVGEAAYGGEGYGGEFGGGEVGEGGVGGGAAYGEVFGGAVFYGGEIGEGAADTGAIYGNAVGDEMIGGGGEVSNAAIGGEPNPAPNPAPEQPSVHLNFDPVQVALYIVLIYRRRLVEPDTDLSKLIVGVHQMRVLAEELYSVSLDELLLDHDVSTKRVISHDRSSPLIIHSYMTLTKP